jgi:cobalamin biosynthesis protein CobD/CbiB
MREMRRFRIGAIAAALVLCVTFGLLTFLVAQKLLLLLPVIMAGWYLFYMPRWRRRVRQRARNLPTWQLHPE